MQSPIPEKLDIFSAAFEQTADHVVITDVEGAILYVNRAFEITTGYTAQEVLGQTPRILKSNRHNKEFYANLWNVVLQGKTFQGTLINKKKNGRLYYADQTITPIQDMNGTITHFIAICKDTTERVQTREKLDCLNANLKIEKQKIEEILNFGEKIESITNFNRLVDFIINEASSILESERCSLMLLDENKGELCIKGAVGLDPDIVKKSKINVGEGIAGVVAREGKAMLVKKAGQDRRFEHEGLPTCRTKSFLSVPIALDHKMIGVINVTDKINQENSTYTELDLKILSTIVRQVAIAIENAQLSKELKYLTIRDPLTSLYNHRHLMECLAYEIKRFRRFKRPLCVLIMDVDNFKEYNDVFGLLEGDIVLKEISEVLKESLREVDIVCRYAGDEFIAILPETSEKEVLRIAEEIKTLVSKCEFAVPVTLSMGIAKCREAMNRHELVLKANALLHKAKDDGKNRIYCQGELG